MHIAKWQGETIAQSDDTEQVEGNAYFPRKDVNMALLTASDTVTHCPWKGQASYYSVVVNGETLKDAAWTYKQPFDKAQHIAGHIAFWNGVIVEKQ